MQVGKLSNLNCHTYPQLHLPIC